VDDRLKWNVRMVSAYHSGFPQLIISPSGSMSILYCICKIQTMSKDLGTPSEIWGLLSSKSYTLVITIFFHILLIWQELINDKLLISMWWENQQMDVTNAVNVDSRWHIMEGQNFEVLENYGKRKMFLVCWSSGVIFTGYGYGITMMRIEIPPGPRGVCVHTLQETLID